MAELKPAYLIHGDDHGAVAERKAGLRALAEREGGADSVEMLEGERATADGVAMAMAAMTLTIGRRVIMVEGVERWKEAEVKERLVSALEQMPPDTTVALFAREEGRTKAPKAVHEAVKKAGGQVVEQGTVKPWELPKWVRAQARRMGMELDATAAKALVAQVGERQQRLLRELEKLALEQGTSEGTSVGTSEGSPSEDADENAPTDGATSGTSREASAEVSRQRPSSGAARPVKVSVQDIEARAARSAEQRAYTLADALVGGDESQSMRAYIGLRAQGERLAGLTYLMAARLRDALAIALRLQAGESAAEVKRGLRMPPKAAERFVADVAKTEPERLREALGVLADLELETRGGSVLPEARTGMSGLDEGTLAVRTIEKIATKP